MLEQVCRQGSMCSHLKISWHSMKILAQMLGIAERDSPLFQKARGLGLQGAHELVGLAISRGCRHYQGGTEPIPQMPVPSTEFSDEELAICLLSPSLPYDQRTVRVGAQMLGSRDNQPSRLALLAHAEQAEVIVRYIATAGRRTEPHEPFWCELLAVLPPASLDSLTIAAGVLPHPSRFRLETGRTAPSDPMTHGGPQVVWLRPSSSVHLAPPFVLPRQAVTHVESLKLMSTKATIAHGNNFHLYRESLDEDHVYLEVEGTQFEASYGRVMVPIPVHIWEVIRRHPGVSLQLASKTDAELRQHVEAALDDRLKWHREAGENAKSLMALSGSLVFGSIDDPREAQFAAGLEYFTRLREHQRQIQQAIEELAQADTRK